MILLDKALPSWCTLQFMALNRFLYPWLYYVSGVFLIKLNGKAVLSIMISVSHDCYIIEAVEDLLMFPWMP
jgi:hypothetical protein